MKKIITPVLLALIVIVGFIAYPDFQQYLQTQQSRQQFEQEKTSLQAAIDKQSVSAIDRFIADHPASDWLAKARFERDKLTYQQAVESDKISNLEQFIAEYPQSTWISQAKNRLQRLRQEKKLLAEIEQKQKKLDAQREQLAQQQSRNKDEVIEETTTPAPATDSVKVESTAPSRPASGISATERVNRALSIYQQQRQQEQQVIEQRKQEQLKEEQKKRECAALKAENDKFRYNFNYYDLNGDGKKTYMTKHQIIMKKKELQAKYDEMCGQIEKQ
jgi:hypothetical protein